MTSAIANAPAANPTARHTPSVHVRSFRPEDTTAFRLLNEEWISHFFRLEEEDHMLLGDPATHILAPGGHIFVAELADSRQAIVVGCCALIPVTPGHMLLGKMAVSSTHRNLGIGRKLLTHTIAEARSLGLKLITLETSHILENAIHLYASLGFTHVPPERIIPSHLSRADVFMELYL